MKALKEKYPYFEEVINNWKPIIEDFPEEVIELAFRHYVINKFVNYIKLKYPINVERFTTFARKVACYLCDESLYEDLYLIYLGKKSIKNLAEAICLIHEDHILEFTVKGVFYQIIYDKYKGLYFLNYFKNEEFVVNAKISKKVFPILKSISNIFIL